MNENKEKKVELTEEQLNQVTGGAINVFDAGPYKREYWKYTCHACGNVGVVDYKPDGCLDCKSANITCEEYKR